RHAAFDDTDIRRRLTIDAAETHARDPFGCDLNGADALFRADTSVGLEPVNLDLEAVRGGRAGKQEADGVAVENEPRVRAQPGHIETLGADETGLLADGEDNIDRSAGNVVFMERAKHFANDG